MNRKEEALRDFGDRYNCSQTVMNVFCEELGIDRETALKLTKGFGGGASRGELCGAVSAGIMVLGLKYGDDSNKYIDELEKRIEEIYGSIRCEKMLGYNVLDKKKSETIENKKIKSETCPRIVEDIVIMLEDLI